MSVTLRQISVNMGLLVLVVLFINMKDDTFDFRGRLMHGRQNIKRVSLLQFTV